MVKIKMLMTILGIGLVAKIQMIIKCRCTSYNFSFKKCDPSYDQETWTPWSEILCTDGQLIRERCNEYSSNNNCMTRERQRKSCDVEEIVEETMDELLE